MMETNLPQMIAFYREATSGGRRWYADLPAYPGEKGDLEMIYGADDLLDQLGQGQQRVALEVALEAFPGASELVLREATPEITGSVYEPTPPIAGIESVWLCGVTEYYFGFLPDRIYYVRP